MDKLEKTLIAAPSIIHGDHAPLADDLRRARIRGFFDNEAYEGDWWGCITLQDGSIYSATGKGFVPPADHIGWAQNLCSFLNREVHNFGCWVVILYPGGRRFAMAWMDEDGDLHVVGEEEDVPVDIAVLAPLELYGQHAQEMIDRWVVAIAEVEPKPEQQVKLAAGQRSQEPIAPPVLMSAGTDGPVDAAAGRNGRSR